MYIPKCTWVKPVLVKIIWVQTISVSLLSIWPVFPPQCTYCTVIISPCCLGTSVDFYRGHNAKSLTQQALGSHSPTHSLPTPSSAGKNDLWHISVFPFRATKSAFVPDVCYRYLYCLYPGSDVTPLPKSRSLWQAVLDSQNPMIGQWRDGIWINLSCDLVTWWFSPSVKGLEINKHACDHLQSSRVYMPWALMLCNESLILLSIRAVFRRTNCKCKSRISLWLRWLL